MIIVVTGMVGIDKKQYLSEVCDYARQRGRSIHLYNVGSRMYEEAPDIPAGRILDISLGRLHSLRRSVFKDIIAKSREYENVIVNTHATFRWRHGLFPAFDFYQMRQLHPDLFICLIDGVEPLHLRLTREHPIHHTLKDLIVWREEEVLATQMMQQGTSEKAPCYILARGLTQPSVETFYRLAFEPRRKKAYLSFPMTHVAGLADVQTAIEAFRKSMKTLLTCFDPADLEEAYLPLYAEQAQREGRHTVSVTVLGQAIELDAAEVRQIERDIRSQIYARDFALIDQSDMIVSFIPELPDGMPALSSGVERELQHAHEAAKQVYVIWMPKNKKPSIFITQTANRVFRCPDEAMDYFETACGYKSDMLFE
ncbi:MAG TPA: AAA family ATPase [Anaerohalosphaeraceae bacterium]|nr:AAA family ATPase [Phycisphaerae bacterium]HOK96673.1 AAA family ATPase [Anaerohalosphaeraceae bacterium]HOL32140.1 AAA family ATPase [Anaerohalosphaeraceae bacterium]HOM76680.1 AAA family ATPase [Anaerohalosphaeraceae bacterium]HPC65068.1 AAA family ATPase [Anaerohalosphaeraceae bacterium]